MCKLSLLYSLLCTDCMVPLTRSRPKLNCGPGRDFEVGPEFGAARKQPIIPICQLSAVINILRIQIHRIFQIIIALVFEAVQSRPSTTFPESWHDF